MNFHYELRKSSCRKELKRRTGRSLDILAARTDGSMFPQVGTVPDSVLSGRGPHLRHRPGGAAHRLDGYAGGCTL